MLTLALLRLIPAVVWVIATAGNFGEYLSSFLEPNYSKWTYDVIIVGGGSAGCVLASRLSEDPDLMVLLIEAGGAPSAMTSIPVLAPQMQMSPYDWAYETVPQDHACRSMHGQRCKWPRGRMLGGSGGLNYMFYARGHRQDFDTWSNLTGAPEWAFDEVLPYFIKAESQVGSSNFRGDEPYHGHSGPLPVRYSPFSTPISEGLRKMAESLGLWGRDYNGEEQEGFSKPQVNVDKWGRRADTYSTYLNVEVRSRRNLHILKHSLVTRVLLDQQVGDPAGQDNKATGVEVLRYGRTFEVRTLGEVILSAGTISSPQILMLSGVGPQDHLAELQVPVKVNLAQVGQNLHDHPTTILGPFLSKKQVLLDVLRTTSLATVAEYLTNGTGPMSTALPGDAIGFLRTTASEPIPDVQYHISGIGLHGDYGAFFPKLFGIKAEVWESYLAPNYGIDAMTILPVVLRPKSRGTIRLKSRDPLEKPNIDPQYLSHPDDSKALVKAIQVIRRMLLDNGQELREELGLDLPKAPLLGCEEAAKPLFSDLYWACFVQHLTMTMYHPVGTCRMGRTPEDSVVDANLRVHRVPNLRIADASIMPSIVGGNTNAPTVMIAEKAADLIKGDLRRNKLVLDREAPPPARSGARTEL